MKSRRDLPGRALSKGKGEVAAMLVVPQSDTLVAEDIYMHICVSSCTICSSSAAPSMARWSWRPAVYTSSSSLLAVTPVLQQRWGIACCTVHHRLLCFTSMLAACLSSMSFCCLHLPTLFFPLKVQGRSCICGLHTMLTHADSILAACLLPDMRWCDRLWYLGRDGSKSGGTLVSVDSSIQPPSYAVRIDKTNSIR